MIEIIKNSNRKYKITCGCGCEFTFQDEDVRHEKEIRQNVYAFEKELEMITHKYIICPCCKEELNLETWHYEVV